MEFKCPVTNEDVDCEYCESALTGTKFKVEYEKGCNQKRFCKAYKNEKEN